MFMSYIKAIYICLEREDDRVNEKKRGTKREK